MIVESTKLWKSFDLYFRCAVVTQAGSTFFSYCFYLLLFLSFSLVGCIVYTLFVFFYLIWAMEFPQSVHARSIVQEHKQNKNLSIKIQGARNRATYSMKRYCRIHHASPLSCHLISTIVLAIRMQSNWLHLNKIKYNDFIQRSVLDT